MSEENKSPQAEAAPQITIEAPSTSTPAPVSETTKTSDTPAEVKTPAAAELKSKPQTDGDNAGEPNPEVSFEDFAARKAGIIKEKPKAKDGQTNPLVQAPNKQLPAARDVSMFDEPHRAAATQMSNEAFATFKEIYTNAKNKEKELQTYKQQIETLQKAPGKLPDSYYSHPNAYVLSEDYVKASSALSQASSVKNHYTEQLAKIRRGEPWQDLESDNNEIYITQGEKEPNAQAEAHVLNMLQQSMQWEIQYQNQLKGIVTGHKQQHETDINILKQAEEKYFKGYDAPDHPTKKVQDAFITLLPPAYRNNPLAKILSKTVANNLLFSEENKKLKAELAKLSQPQQPAQQIKTGETIAGNGGGKREISMEDFAKRRAGLVV